MDVFESLENLKVSESCFDDIVGIVESIINENAVDDYYSKKLSSMNQELANTKALKRHLNKTVDKNARAEYKKAKGAQRELSKRYDELNRESRPFSAFDKERDEEMYANYDADKDRRYDELDKEADGVNKKLDSAKGKFSKKGTDAYNKILALTKGRDKLLDKMNKHLDHKNSLVGQPKRRRRSLSDR